MAGQAECRTCGAAIIWAKSPKGKNMPLDVDSEGGDWNLVEGNPPRARFAGAGEGDYTCHFATCPQADEHRREEKRPIQECPKCGHKFVGKA